MRIRRKKHLGERLEGVGKYLIVPDRQILNVKEAIKVKAYIDYKTLYGNDNPINLEIGCGKGGFITEQASNSPNENFLAVELLENIIVMAAEQARALGLKNLYFMNSAAEYLPRYIKPQSVKKLFLNFSPPYPQKGYETRRLTCDRFMEYYKEFLTADGIIIQKTDDKNFFDYSLSQFQKFGYKVTDVSDKIASGELPNVQTEYEKKFRAQNMPIYCLYATL